MSENPYDIWDRECLNARDYVVRGVRFSNQADLAIEAARRLLGVAHILAGIGCQRCGGQGERTYPSTSLWGGGCGGAALSVGTCDQCWGTGRTDRTGTDLRSLRDRLREVRDE